MFLISRLASFNENVRKQVNIDFSPYLEKIFQIGLKLLDVPIGSDAANPRKTDYSHDLSFLVKKKVRFAFCDDDDDG